MSNLNKEISQLFVEFFINKSIILVVFIFSPPEYEKSFLKFFGLALGLLLIELLSSVSAAPADRDTSFDERIPSFDARIFSLAIQNDGKTILEGQFTTYQGVNANRIIRLNSDGSRDTSLNIGNGFDGTTNIIKIQNNGKMIIVGQFTNYQGVSANRIIRLNTDGTRDSSFNIGNGFDDYVQTLAIQSDGKIIVGGRFTTYQGVSANRIIRLNTDGSRDSSFNIGNGFNNWVHDIAIKDEGEIIVGGYFNNYQGVAARYLIRLRGSKLSEGSLPVFLSDTQIIAYLLKTKKTVDPKWLFMGTIPLYF